MTIAIHTVFLARENILFINEWIDYHIKIGFDKFYLYDNSKSVECLGEQADLNKYNYDYRRLTEHLSNEDIDRILMEVSSGYNGRVTIIEWSPTGEDNKVVYGQKSSILHYFQNCSNSSDWTAFIDMDEFIYCSGNLKTILADYHSLGAGSVTILQKKFDDRFNNIGIPVTDIVRCIDNLDTHQWAQKIILRNVDFDYEFDGDWSIHFLPIKRGKYFLARLESLRFNHYNVNLIQLKWMKKHFNSEIDFSLNAECFQLRNLMSTKS